ncbi:MAG TPA: SGNH/GDSL hydrolase family protein [Steroidobacteraceae bacterium]|jgi:outer membrane lipase/esterase
MSIQSLTAWGFKFLALTLIISGPALAGEAANRFVVFGDSLSDPGNYYYLFGQVSEPPFAPIPSAPYDEHGHRFTNGPTWIEQLTFLRLTEDSGRPAFAKPGVYTNYAVGRARARPGAPVFAYYDLGAQVAAFLNDFHGVAPDHTTYVIWIGANDLDDALAAAQVSTDESTLILQSALVSLASNIQTLWAAGARSFFVPNLPDFGLTPAAQSLGPEGIAGATQLSTLYNGYLAQTLAQLQALPDIKITTLDVFSVLHVVVAHPAAFGILDVQTPCLSFGVTVDPICSYPNTHLFWDAIHPTVAGHVALEEAAGRALRAAPLAAHDEHTKTWPR